MMLNTPLEWLCSPLLIGQGLSTQWKTPHLPEAQGQRTGQIGHGKPLRLLITGDSAAAGVGANWQTDALSGQLLNILQHHYQCDWALYAKSGLSTAQLCDFLTHQPQQSFDIAVVSIGVNDVTKMLSIKKWKQHLNHLQQILSEYYGVYYVIYTAVPPMAKFPALPQPLRYFLGQTAENMNQELVEYCASRLDCGVLKLNLPFETQYMAVDGFHPSPKAYQLWAQHTADIIEDIYLYHG